MQQREARLRAWLSGPCAFDDFDLTVVAGDASFRRYFRVHPRGRASVIVMDAPPEHEDCAPFVDVTSRLLDAGVHVPKVLQMDLQQGFLLLEDLGDRLYLPELTADSVDGLYADAIAALVQFQQSGQTEGLPPYDRDLLEREISLFPDWLLKRHLQIDLSEAQGVQLQQVFAVLVDNALEQPHALVHRDYHSRNLLICESGNPGIIDHQDAVHGPLSYDLVSLLRDCYVRWDDDRIIDFRDRYMQAALNAGLLRTEQVQRFPRWFDLMGVQRHLKAAGIFARLWHRDGKRGYLADIPRTLGYIESLGPDYPELEPLVSLITERVQPVLARQ